MAIEISKITETEILADLNSIAQNFGLINQVFETSRINIYYAIFARVFGNLFQIIATYIETNTLEDCTDEAVLENLIEPFIIKKSAKTAKVILTFKKRDMTTNLEDIYIPRGLEVMTEGDDPIIFRTAESKIFWKDSYRIRVPAYAVNFGSIYNVKANTLTYFDGDLFHDIEVTNENDAYGGYDEETAFDARNRIASFRYNRDGSLLQIEDSLSRLGFFGADYNIKEYWDGLGSVLIALDCNSDEEFQDYVSMLQTEKVAGIKYHYARVLNIFLDIKVTAKVLGEKFLGDYEQSTFEDDLVTAINLYFSQQVYTGQSINVKRLEAFVLNYIYANYNVYEINLEILNIDEINRIEKNDSKGYDAETYMINIEPYERLKADRIITQIEYNYLEDE